MCGIALVAGGCPNEATLRVMLEALRPRGEVGAVRAGTGLIAGVQWLRIVDPERAAQPWTSADGRWLLCYNGEIFNYRALRGELEQLGCQFGTDSDTEVLAEAFSQWGETAVRRLRGEDAVALGDLADGRVSLARDPVGVTPAFCWL